jgi:hypothetical protein
VITPLTTVVYNNEPYRLTALGFTQPLTEMSTMGSKVRLVRKADNLGDLWAYCLDNVGSLTSHNPTGLHGLLRVSFTLLYRLTITILDIIHRPVFYLKYDVSVTGFCLHLQVEPTQLGPIDRASLCLCHKPIDLIVHCSVSSAPWKLLKAWLVACLK